MKKLEKVFTKGRKGYYNFLCGCGQYKILRGDSSAKSCQQTGCTISNLRQHGESKTRLYNIWSGMRDRCFGSHKSNIHYKNKGITICDEWKDFNVFSSWAYSHGYKDNLTIDRINIDGNYTPDNCEWITRSENTTRQLTDRHHSSIPTYINPQNTNELLEFCSITKAAKYLEQHLAINVRSIKTALERRYKNPNTNSYHGFYVYF